MIIETHDAKVTNNQDPEKRGRIKVACVALLGDEETELPMWLDIALDWGWFYVPDVGEIVEVDVVVSSEQDASFHQMSIDNLDIKWKGKRLYTSETVDGQTEVRLPHEDFTKENYGKRRGFATPSGLILLFDDTEGKEKIQLTWKQGEKYSYITFDEKGSILIANKNGSFINIDAETEALTIVEQHGNLINMTENGISLIDKFSNIIELKDKLIQIISQDGIALTGKSSNLKTGTVDLAEGADSFLVKGTTFKITFDTHVHPTAFGPSGPPVIPMPITDLSTVVKTK